MASALAAARTLRVVRCQVGDKQYALALSQVRGFQRTDRLRREPGADGRVGHLPAAAGDLPVYALADLLAQPGSAAHAMPHIILLRAEQGLWGLLVEHVSQVLTLEAEDTKPLPSLVRSWSGVPAERVILRGKELLLLLCPERLHPAAVPTAAAFADPDAEPEEDVLLGPSARGQMMLFATADPTPGERPLVFGLSLAAVGEILDLPPLAPVPRAPAFLLGLAVWRRRAVPVVDLAPPFGLAPSRVDRRSRLLVVRAGTGLGWVGLLVRPGLQLMPWSVPHLPCHRALPLDRSRVWGAAEIPNKTVVLPDLKRLLTLT
jgi:purine-binding chemotaxis protein CheW